MTGPRARSLTGLILFAASLAVWIAGARHAPVLNHRAAEQMAYRQRVIAGAAPVTPLDAQSLALAEAYWRRYPDVGNDGYYGRQGPFGERGAAMHYEKHGRNEGRQWGL